MKRMVFCTAFTSLLLIPVIGWTHGFDRRDPALDAFSRQRIQSESRVGGPVGIEATTGGTRDLLIVVLTTASDTVVQDDQRLQRRRDVQRRRGAPMPADAGKQPPQETAPAVIEPPPFDAPQVEEPQKTFDQDNQELFKALKGAGVQ